MMTKNVVFASNVDGGGTQNIDIEAALTKSLKQRGPIVDLDDITLSLTLLDKRVKK